MERFREIGRAVTEHLPFLEREREITGILIANRGDCAIRIFQTCLDENWPAILVYTKEAENSPFLERARRWGAKIEQLGGPTPRSCYFDRKQLIQMAQYYHASYIHGGWGFLAEDFEFAQMAVETRLLARADLEAWKKMANKLAFKNTMRKAGVPGVPGPDVLLESAEETLAQLSLHFNYPNYPFFPAYLKSAFGGGGKAIERVGDEAGLRKEFPVIQALAREIFGFPQLYLEQALTGVRHLEVPVAADKHSVVCLGVRDCSLQIRHQKIIEETPRQKFLKTSCESYSNLRRPELRN